MRAPGLPTLPPAALGPLIQALSLLVWALPLAVVLCVQMARTDWLHRLGPWPAVVSTGLLWAAAHRLAAVDPDPRWLQAVDRLRLLALLNWGLSPFVYWHGRLPQQPWFEAMALVAAVGGLLFLMQLNRMLYLLTDRLPAEGLRQEVKVLVPWNQAWLMAGLGLLLVAEGLSRYSTAPAGVLRLLAALDRHSLMLWVTFLLAPLAMTMALLWKTKNVAWQTLLQHAVRS